MSYVIGNAIDVLRSLEPDRFQCCVTSPPYWGLRDYGHPDQLGQESTPEAYVERLVGIMREVRRVLRPDGVLWLNLGDSYATRWGSRRAQGRAGLGDTARSRGGRVPQGLKEKDLVGVPWMAAFALRADGWWLRQDVIWHKLNPTPEPVKDRCTRSHEYLFMLTRAQDYFYDAQAIKEPETMKPQRRLTPRGARTDAKTNGLPVHRRGGSGGTGGGLRNKRDVWPIPTRPYKGAHFAVFPPALVEPCILAGSRPGDEVLDPFLGSGTVGEVARKHGRRWFGVELNSDYAPLIDARTGLT